MQPMGQAGNRLLKGAASPPFPTAFGARVVGLMSYLVEQGPPPLPRGAWDTER